MESTTFEILIDKYIRFAEENIHIRASFIIGSRARTDQPADRWSDLDIVLLTDNPEFFLGTTEWLESIHPFSITFLEKLAVGDGLERRVLFEPDLDVDFIIIPTNNFSGMLHSEEIRSVFQRGIRILLDKDGITNKLEELPPAQSPVLSPVSEREFDENVQDFWYHCIWAMKKMVRGELWVAKGCLEGDLKFKLLTIMEWNSHIKGIDSWHKGRFIESWGDSRAINSFPKIFPRYGAEDMISGLRKMMDLFYILSKELADDLQFRYPEKAAKAAINIIENYTREIIRD